MSSQPEAVMTPQAQEFYARAQRFMEKVGDEFLRASKMHSPMNSLHEAYAVMLEEVDELWDEVRKKDSERFPLEVRDELIQIAAMCMRACVDLKLESLNNGRQVNP